MHRVSADGSGRCKRDERGKGEPKVLEALFGQSGRTSLGEEDIGLASWGSCWTLPLGRSIQNGPSLQDLGEAGKSIIQKPLPEDPGKWIEPQRQVAALR